MTARLPSRSDLFKMLFWALCCYVTTCDVAFAFFTKKRYVPLLERSHVLISNVVGRDIRHTFYVILLLRCTCFYATQDTWVHCVWFYQSPPEEVLMVFMDHQLYAIKVVGSFCRFDSLGLIRYRLIGLGIRFWLKILMIWKSCLKCRKSKAMVWTPISGVVLGFPHWQFVVAFRCTLG